MSYSGLPLGAVKEDRVVVVDVLVEHKNKKR